MGRGGGYKPSTAVVKKGRGQFNGRPLKTNRPNIEHQQRMKIVLEMRMAGMTYAQIAEAAKHPDTGERLYHSGAAVAAAVSRYVGEIAKPVATEILHNTLARYDFMIRRLTPLVKNDTPWAFGEMREINKELSKLFGLYDIDAKLGAYLTAKTAETVDAMQAAFVETMGALGLSEAQQATAHTLMAENLRRHMPADDAPGFDGIIDAEVVEE